LEAFIIITSLKDRLLSIVVLITSLALLVFIISLPGYFKNSACNAIKVCLTNVIPSLFCFIVITKIIVASGFAYIISLPFGKLFYKLTGLPPFTAGIYLISFLSGFPSGAIAAVDMYKNNVITRADAERLIAISNNTGPALPVLLIGINIFSSAYIGFIIFIIQILASLLTAFVMKTPYKRAFEPYYPDMTSDAVTAVCRSVDGSIKACAQLCAYVILFSCLIDLISLSDSMQFILCRIMPFIEIVSGSINACTLIGARSFIYIASAVSFGGICVHMQAASVCIPSGLSLKLHFKTKLLQSFFAFVLALIFIFISGLV